MTHTEHQKWAIVTGATGGIGRAICQALFRSGWSLLLVARHEEALGELQRQLGDPEHGCEVRTLPLDITQEGAAQRLVSVCQALPGACRLLINGAGCQRFAWLEDQEDAQIARQIQLNLLAPIRLTRALLPLLDRHSSVVNIGSTFGAIGYPGCAVYCASKAGLHRFTEALGRELGAQGPRVLLLAPRATDTELNVGALEALNRQLGTAVDTPERVASELMQLLASSSKQRFIGWPEKLFARVNALLPFMVDGAIAKQWKVIRQFARQFSHQDKV